jgi:hypothetical protein
MVEAVVVVAINATTLWATLLIIKVTIRPAFRALK